MVILVIIKDLIKTVSNYFINGIIPKSLKEFIIMILRKKKRNFFFLSSYKLIPFKNMLVKVLEKHIANIMFKAIKKYRLFLWN